MQNKFWMKLFNLVWNSLGPVKTNWGRQRSDKIWTKIWRRNAHQEGKLFQNVELICGFEEIKWAVILLSPSSVKCVEIFGKIYMLEIAMPRLLWGIVGAKWFSHMEEMVDVKMAYCSKAGGGHGEPGEIRIREWLRIWNKNLRMALFSEIVRNVIWRQTKYTLNTVHSVTFRTKNRGVSVFGNGHRRLFMDAENAVLLLLLESSERHN